MILSAVLSACATQRGAPDLTDRQAVDLEDTPFFPQRDYQCGPAGLATVLVSSGIEVTPEDLIAEVYTPGREGSLQIDLVAAARRYARIPYVIEPALGHLLDELDAARPVLVLQNLGFSFKPVWHYAVVTGYDPAVGAVYLRSGTERHKAMPVKKFERTWQLAGAWALILLSPGELPANPDADKLLEAAVAMENAQDPDFMVTLYRSFLQHFPDDHIARLGLANSYLNSGDLRRAIDLYRYILNIDHDNVAAGNNLAIALSQANCGETAQVQARLAASLSREKNLFTAESRRTLEQVEIDAESAYGKNPYADLCD